MSSMTDLVFLLLIFFMIASTLAKQLNTIDVQLPKATGKSENRNSTAVTIDGSGNFYVNTVRVAKTRLENYVLQQLSDQVLPSIILRAEKKVAIEEVVYVMNFANRNGIKVVLAVDAR